MPVEAYVRIFATLRPIDRSGEIMSFARRTVFAAACCLSVAIATAAEERSADPLFRSNEILDVRIVAPLKTLLSERSFDEELPATFEYTDSENQLVEFDIKIRTRGRFRRQEEVCRFPPIRLNFKTSQTKSTLFHKQDKVKLVTHCQTTSTYEQALLKEYTAYRILNVMTDASFRVRLMRITYVDSDEKIKESVRYGFIIEHRERLAKRLQKSVLDIPQTDAASLDAAYANKVSLYHFLIGNTDFSAIRGSHGDACCHNHVLFANEGEAITSIPYDFDQSGLVNAPHAGPNPMFKIRSVRDRLYRGRCVNNTQLEKSITAYNDKRDELLSVASETGAASKRTTKSMTGYINDFYKILESEKKVNSKLITKCI
jgi:hypothetical protein